MGREDCKGGGLAPLLDDEEDGSQGQTECGQPDNKIEHHGGLLCLGFTTVGLQPGFKGAELFPEGVGISALESNPFGPENRVGVSQRFLYPSQILRQVSDLSSSALTGPGRCFRFLVGTGGQGVNFAGQPLQSSGHLRPVCLAPGSDGLLPPVLVEFGLGFSHRLLEIVDLALGRGQKALFVMGLEGQTLVDQCLDPVQDSLDLSH